MTEFDNKVVVVKVHRASAGSDIPFDKLYFFPKSKTDAIPKLFGYALVFPCEPSLMAEITKLKPKALNAYRHRRDDALLNQKPDVDGRKHTADEVGQWWQTNILTPYRMQDRVVVVSILTSKIRKKINPRYLTSPKWFNGAPRGKRKRRLHVKPSERQAVSDFAYLATPLPAPHDQISPICSICPRQLLQFQGQCVPGQAICLKSLNFNEIGNQKDIPPAGSESTNGAPNTSHTDEYDDEEMATTADDSDEVMF